MNEDYAVGSLVFCSRRNVYGLIVEFADTAFGTAITIAWPNETEVTNVYSISPVGSQSEKPKNKDCFL